MENILREFTQPLYLTSVEFELDLLIKPGTDIDGTFEAWCLDTEEIIHVNGWMFSDY